MALLLIAAAAVPGLALGERLDALAIGLIVLLNVGIAVIQEQRASSALAALERLQALSARVRRDGSVRLIPAAGNTGHVGARSYCLRPGSHAHA